MMSQYSIRAEAGKSVQREFLGKTHTVIPLIALVEGVLRGANAPAPEFVSAEQMEKTILGWNGRPVVIDHPKVNGVFTSANQPEILETELVGQVFNARVEDGKMKMEAWILNEEKGVDRIDGTLEKVREGEIVELSTGFFADAVPSPGVFEGENFENLLQNIVPDHLAILSEGVGACSVADGAGTNRVNVARRCDDDEVVPPRPEIECHVKEHPFRDFLTRVFGVKLNLTHSDVEYALRAKIIKDVGDDFFYIVGVSDSHVTYMTWDGLYQRAYEIAGDGSVNLGDEVIEVRPETDFVPLIGHEETQMPKDTKPNVKVDGLITNAATKFTEDDREWLEGLEDEQLERLEPVALQAPDALTEPEVRTFEDVLASAPADVRESIEHGRRLLLDHRAGLIETIKANDRNKFSDEQLSKFDIDNLEALAALAAKDDYLGRNLPRQNQDGEDDAVPEPVLVFERNDAA